MRERRPEWVRLMMLHEMLELELRAKAFWHEEALQRGFRDPETQPVCPRPGCDSVWYCVDHPDG